MGLLHWQVNGLQMKINKQQAEEDEQHKKLASPFLLIIFGGVTKGHRALQYKGPQHSSPEINEKAAGEGG
jgi:hypothetical protein